jgi:spermidine/putrescine transport system permease protein
MSATSVETAPAKQRVRLRDRLANPWGRPRFLAITTWLYIAWSLIPVLLAIRFAFNSGRSRTSLQGWSLRWFWQDPTLSVFHDPTLQAALTHSLELALIVMVVATPLGTALALGMRRWIGPGSGIANIVLLLPAIGQVTFTLSWVVLIVRGRLAIIGREVEEAAADLGAPPMQVVWRVLLPLLVPAMAASLLVSFALSIDDFVVSQYLASGADTTTVPMRIYSQARGGPPPALNALATIMRGFTLFALARADVVDQMMTRGEEKTSAVKTLAMDMG